MIDKKEWVIASLSVAALVVIVGMFVTWWLYFDESHHTAIVVDAEYIITRQYQTFNAHRVYDTDRDEVPSGAYSVACSNYTQRIGDVPVTSTSCDYTINQWQDIDRLVSSGRRGTPVVEPELRQYRACENLQPNQGCERELPLRYQWRIHFSSEDAFFHCDVSNPAWDDVYLIETVWQIEKTRGKGWLCPTLGK